MYTNHKSALYVVAMLKKRGIRNIVVSPGNSHNPLVRSVDEDPFFHTYCITDERSAAFFAIGVAQSIQAPVAIMCTSGTAVCNYISGVTEAYRRNIPLIVITADKHPYFRNQLEDQMINQPPLFKDITKYAVSLPEIVDEKDDWYCRRLLNEAFLEMNHHGTGPIHINVPISYGMFAIGNDFTTPELPVLNRIDRLDAQTSSSTWDQIFATLKGKRILFLCGQDITFNQEELELLDTVSKGFNCILGKDPLSNLHLERTIALERVLHKAQQIKPDVVITLNGSTAASIKYQFKITGYTFEHWLVHEQGTVADPYRKLRYVIESDTVGFLRIMAHYAQPDTAPDYFECCKEIENEFQLPDLPYSQAFAMQQFLKTLPADCILHLGNSSTIRLAQFFTFHPQTQIFCNRGVNGIDGCMSSFIGHAASTDKTCFLLIGDLTFFYDMNALWNRYVGRNVRILLFNNGGAALFHYNQGTTNFPTLNENVAAEHATSAKGWVESIGCKYLSASNEQELLTALETFTSPDSDKPIILEVFTQKDEDAVVWHSIPDTQQKDYPQPRHGFGIKTKIKSIIKRSLQN